MSTNNLHCLAFFFKNQIVVKNLRIVAQWFNKITNILLYSKCFFSSFFNTILIAFVFSNFQLFHSLLPPNREKTPSPKNPANNLLCLSLLPIPRHNCERGNNVRRSLFDKKKNLRKKLFVFFLSIPRHICESGNDVSRSVFDRKIKRNEKNLLCSFPLFRDTIVKGATTSDGQSLMFQFVQMDQSDREWTKIRIQGRYKHLLKPFCSAQIQIQVQIPIQKNQNPRKIKHI